MKLLHICTGWPLSLQGGITNYVRQLAQTQFDNGMDVTVLGYEDNKEYPFRYVSFKSKIVPFSYTPLEDKESLKWLDEFLQKEKYDVIHIHALEYVDWDVYSILKEYRYIISLHDYCFICPRVYMYSKSGTSCSRYDDAKCSKCVSFLDRFKIIRGVDKIIGGLGIGLRVPHIKQNITRERYKRFSTLLNNANYLLPVSERVDEIYRNSGITTRSKVLHIGNISADNYKTEYFYDSSPHIIKILFLGRLTKYKGAELFLKIAYNMKDSKNIEFHFMGYAAGYEKRLSKAGIINHGKYNQNQLSQLLCEYDMGMVLSVWEDNGPQVVMELLNNHVPVIGTKMGGITDFVNNSNGYIFNPYDEEEVEGLYSFLRVLTTDKIKELKQNITRTTTTAEHYAQLMDIYNELTQSR